MTRESMVVTGATGFLGRHLLDALADRFEIWALSRGSPASKGVSLPAGVRWRSLDIARPGDVRERFSEIGEAGGARFLVHLASHYDFEGIPHPEYQRTNVQGTRNVLESAGLLGVTDVVFASSVAACRFSRSGKPLDETSPPDGDTPYARSKKAGEAMIPEYQQAYRCWIVRLAALYSDWGEYEPLYRFLETWLSQSPRRRVLAGAGETAIPFLHVKDAVSFIEALIEKRHALDPGPILLASPDGATTHLELFEAATAAHGGKRARPLRMPRPLCLGGLWLGEAMGRLMGAGMFERPWMARLIDTRLAVDAHRTRNRMGWAPRPRLGILRRMPFLIQNRKAARTEWLRRNHAALKGVQRYENLDIQRRLRSEIGILARSQADYLASPVRAGRFPRLRGIGRDRLVADNVLLLAALADAVLTGEKAVFQQACRLLAGRRGKDGVPIDEEIGAIDALGDLCVLSLADVSAEPDWSRMLYDHVTMTVQFGIDELYGVMEESGPSAG